MSKKSNPHWSQPMTNGNPCETTYMQRFGDAMELLCAGKRPSEEMLSNWLNPYVDTMDLQNFACEHVPAWAQGIEMIDAAMMLADTPTEGVEHEMRTDWIENKEFS